MAIEEGFSEQHGQLSIQAFTSAALHANVFTTAAGDAASSQRTWHHSSLIWLLFTIAFFQPYSE